MCARRTTHLLVMKRILEYLLGSADHGLLLHSTNSPTVAITYYDVDCVGCPDSRRYITSCRHIIVSPH